MSKSEWVPLFAALGIGSVIAAFVGWSSAKAVAISNHRQNWINALRDDLVEYLKQIDVLHFRMSQLRDTDDLERQQEVRNAAMLVYRRVLMRLNMTENDHIGLAQALEELMTISGNTANDLKIDGVIGMSRVVLKHEWTVTIWGMFTRLVIWIKNRQKAWLGPASE